MSFEDYYGYDPKQSLYDNLISFTVGLTPSLLQMKYMDSSKVDFDKHYGPSLGLACQISTGMLATEIVRHAIGRGKVKFAPHYAHFDPYLMKYKKGYVLWGSKNPIQNLKKWIGIRFLNKGKK